MSVRSSARTAGYRYDVGSFPSEKNDRLQLRLVVARRVAGSVRHERFTNLGVITLPPSVADRLAFWRGLHERLAKLSHRVDTETHAKILTEVHARIQMVTGSEQGGEPGTLSPAHGPVHGMMRSRFG